jgi:hypothetical protein
MYPALDNLTSCKICDVISFLHTKNTSSVEIHCKLYTVYGQNVMSKGTARQWCRIFKDGKTNVRDEESSGLPSAVNDLVQSTDKKFVR